MSMISLLILIKRRLRTIVKIIFCHIKFTDINVEAFALIQERVVNICKRFFLFQTININIWKPSVQNILTVCVFFPIVWVFSLFLLATHFFIGLPITSNSMYTGLLICSKVLLVKSFFYFSLITIMEVQKHSDVLLSHSKESKNVPRPVNFILHYSTEKLLNITDNILCLFVKYLCYIHISLLMSCTHVFTCWILLNLSCDFV